jgi:hypothetical protein
VCADADTDVTRRSLVDVFVKYEPLDLERPGAIAAAKRRIMTRKGANGTAEQLIVRGRLAHAVLKLEVDVGQVATKGPLGPTSCSSPKPASRYALPTSVPNNSFAPGARAS